MIGDLARCRTAAGATGSGKSVCVNTLVTSLICHTPRTLRFLMVDEDGRALRLQRAPASAAVVVTDNRDAAALLKWAVIEMQDRYQGPPRTARATSDNQSRDGVTGVRPWDPGRRSRTGLEAGILPSSS